MTTNKITDTFPPLRREDESITQYGVDGKLLMEFPHGTKAASVTGLSLLNIRRCLDGKDATCGGTFFIYDIESGILLDKVEAYARRNDHRKTGKPVMQLGLRTSIPIKMYKNGKAATGDGFCASRISNCCNGLIQYYRGYKWRFATPEDIKKWGEK